MEFYDYEKRLIRPVKVKIPEFQTGERLNHIVFADQFTRGTLERLGRSADRIRTLAKSREGSRFLSDLLRHRRAMLYFTQPSTRTFLSFEAACQILGIRTSEVRDASTSSESKGESGFDSVRMFSSYFDIVIMRSVIAQFAECCAYMMNDLQQSSRRSIPIVNAGAGADEHPTQALLDIYTISRAFSYQKENESSKRTWLEELRADYPEIRPGIDGKTFGFCGDLRRGRTVRSLTHLLCQFKDVTMYFICPPKSRLAMTNEFRSMLLERKVHVREFESLEDQVDGVPLIEKLDCLYMTRIQREHNRPEDEEEFRQIDFSRYKLTPKLVSRMKRCAAILHPFPRDQEFGEIPTSIDTDPRAYYFRQARNGMWSRAALLAYLFDVDQDIADYYEDYTKDLSDFNEGAL